jgi:hypothetical protein
MGQSLTHLLVHAIFSTKDRRPFLRSEEIRNEIYAYAPGTVRVPLDATSDVAGVGQGGDVIGPYLRAVQSSKQKLQESRTRTSFEFVSRQFHSY